MQIVRYRHRSLMSMMRTLYMKLKRQDGVLRGVSQTRLEPATYLASLFRWFTVSYNCFTDERGVPGA